jgi:hypothetical protein
MAHLCGLLVKSENAEKEMTFVEGGHHGRRAPGLREKWCIVAMAMTAIDSGALMALGHGRELQNHHFQCVEEWIAFPTPSPPPVRADRCQPADAVVMEDHGNSAVRRRWSRGVFTVKMPRFMGIGWQALK